MSVASQDLKGLLGSYNVTTGLTDSSRVLSDQQLKVQIGKSQKEVYIWKRECPDL